jgi:uncharacterized delta-60 repeat protein
VAVNQIVGVKSPERLSDMRSFLRGTPLARRLKTALALEQLEGRNLLSCPPISWCTDPSFTTPGYASGHVFFDTKGEANTMLQEPDGQILMGGWTAVSPENPNWGMIRMNLDGTLDPTFGNDGFVSFSISDNAVTETIKAMALQPADQMIVAVGATTPVPNEIQSLAVARFHGTGLNAGRPDVSFGGMNGDKPGTVTVRFMSAQGQLAYLSHATSVAIQNDGAILIGGFAEYTPNPIGERNYAFLRLLPDGSRDTSFGVNGEVTFRVDFGNEVRSVALLPPDRNGDQKIIFNGKNQSFYKQNAGNDFAIGRLEANGTVDADEFATDSPYPGIRFVDFSAGLAVHNADIEHNDASTGMVFQEIGGESRIVVVGETAYSPNGADYFRDFAITRLRPNGDIDLSFGPPGHGGRQIIDLKYADTAVTVDVQRQGPNADKLIIAGYAYHYDEPLALIGVRLDVNGAFDGMFQGNFSGIIGDGNHGRDIIVLPDDKFIVGGFHTTSETGGFAAIRFCANSTPCAADSRRPVMLDRLPERRRLDAQFVSSSDAIGATRGRRAVETSRDDSSPTSSTVVLSPRSPRPAPRLHDAGSDEIFEFFW